MKNLRFLFDSNDINGAVSFAPNQYFLNEETGEFFIQSCNDEEPTSCLKHEVELINNHKELWL